MTCLTREMFAGNVVTVVTVVTVSSLPRFFLKYQDAADHIFPTVRAKFYAPAGDMLIFLKSMQDPLNTMPHTSAEVVLYKNSNKQRIRCGWIYVCQIHK